MIKNNKLFILGVGILVVVGVIGYLSIDKYQTEPLDQQNEESSNEVQEQNMEVTKVTGKVDDLIESLEKDLYEEAGVVYEEDQDTNTVNSDSAEINGMASSTDGGEL